MFVFYGDFNHSDGMKDWQKLVLCVVGCELVGLSGTFFTASAIPEWYSLLNKPVFAPPNWIFGPVWTTLYALMGVSYFLIWRQGWQKKKVKKATVLFLIQLGLNWLWTPLFFGFRQPGLALLEIFLLWLSIIWLIKSTGKLSTIASWLLFPYLGWVTFAMILNAAIWWLN